MDADGMVPSPLARWIHSHLFGHGQLHQASGIKCPSIWSAHLGRRFLTMQGFKVQTGGQNGKQSR